MERIGVVGTSWRDRAPDALAEFFVPVEQQPEFVQRIASELNVAEAFYLATCNRVEVGFVGAGDRPLHSYRPKVFELLTGRAASPGEAERTLRAWGGEGAVEHLFLVAAGLDSARLGEFEITGQLRAALEVATSVDLIGIRLRRLLEEALRTGALVQQSTNLGNLRTSLADIAIGLTLKLSKTQDAVAVVGVSPMTQASARSLARRGRRLYVVNRTLAHALPLAGETGGLALSLSEFLERPPAIGALISATSASEPVLTADCLQRLAARASPPILIDLAVPADVPKNAAAEYGLVRYGMNEVVDLARNAQQESQKEAAEARVLVDAAVQRYRQKLTDRMVGPLVALVQDRYRETVDAGLERLFEAEFAALDRGQKAALTRFGNNLARRLAQLPCAAIKHIAMEVGAEGVRGLLERADPKLAGKFAASLEKEETPQVTSTEDPG